MFELTNINSEVVVIGIEKRDRWFRIIFYIHTEAEIVKKKRNMYGVC